MASRPASRPSIGVRILDEAIVAAAELFDRYIRDRFLPDKAIDLIDQSGARVRLRGEAAVVEDLEQDVEDVRVRLLDLVEENAQGRTVDFKHSVVIMTSNLGADRIQQFARQGGDFDRRREELMEILRGSFRLEFINRIDEIIVFRALPDEQIADITRLLLDRLARRLRAQRIDVEFSEEATRLLAREGFDPEVGARPLRRTIQRLVERALADGAGRFGRAGRQGVGRRRGEGLGLGAGLESREAMREAAYASTAGEERLLQEARRRSPTGCWFPSR